MNYLTLEIVFNHIQQCWLNVKPVKQQKQQTNKIFHALLLEQQCMKDFVTVLTQRQYGIHQKIISLSFKKNSVSTHSQRNTTMPLIL